MPDYEIEVSGKTYEMHSDKPLDQSAITGIVAKFKKQSAAPPRPAVSTTDKKPAEPSLKDQAAEIIRTNQEGNRRARSQYSQDPLAPINFIAQPVSHALSMLARGASQFHIPGITKAPGQQGRPGISPLQQEVQRQQGRLPLGARLDAEDPRGFGRAVNPDASRTVEAAASTGGEGIAKGIAGFAMDFATVDNAVITAAMSKVGGPSGILLGKAAAGVFGYQAASQTHEELMKWKKSGGKDTEALTKAVLSAGVAGTAFYHGVGGKKGVTKAVDAVKERMPKPAEPLAKAAAKDPLVAEKKITPKPIEKPKEDAAAKREREKVRTADKRVPVKPKAAVAEPPVKEPAKTKPAATPPKKPPVVKTTTAAPEPSAKKKPTDAVQVKGTTAIPDRVSASKEIQEGPNFEASRKLVRLSGKPGVAIEPLVTSVGEFASIPHVVERDATGKPIGIMQMHTDPNVPDSKEVNYISITTKPGSKGVGERLVRHAIEQEYDITTKFDENMFTKSGAKFANRIIDKAKKDVALREKGPQELGTFNPLKLILGDDRYEEANKKLTELYQGTRATVNPGGFDKTSKQNALMGRDYLAQREREGVQRETQLKRVRHAFDRIVSKSPGHAVRFLFNMEGGNVHADPAAQSYGDVFRKMLDDKRTQVQGLGTGALDFYIDNYFPHIWKDPARAAQTLGAGKAPLEGRKSFLKQRTIPTIEEGMFPQGSPANLDTMSMKDIKAEVKRQGGLEPLTYNPAEMVQLKLQEQDRYIFGQKWFKEMKDNKLAQFVRFGAKAPDGYIKIDDKIARVLNRTPGGTVIRGEWMAPEGTARVMNNHLSPGIGGHPTIGPAFRAINYVNNSMNMAQLGLSGFHATTTALNSIISENARAFDLATSGKPISAAKAALTSPVAPIRDYWQGTKILKEYRNAGTVGGDIPAIVDSLVKGGGRVTLAKEFRLNAMESFGKAIRMRDVRSIAGNALPAALESTMAPLMRDAVPKMKLGAFAELMRDEIARNPTASVNEQRAIASRAWDSIENRFGQLNYDNLFWDKAFQDAGHLAVRSLGWNLGTLRELGGAGLDAAGTRARLRSGGRVLTPRMAYSMSLVYTTALAGAVYGYLHGRPPKTLEDYFTPVGPEGKRVQLPTYMKDVRGYSSDPIETVYNKKSPLADIAIETLQNKDFIGKPIRNKQDPAVKQAEEYFRYLAKQMAPFSIRGTKDDSAMATVKKSITTQSGRERAMGITPVSGQGKPKKKSGGSLFGGGGSLFRSPR